MNNGANEMNTETKLITPAMATALLAANENNRPVNAAHVSMLANEITGGRWRLNGQPIIVSDDGFLLDGQHRLHAIVKSGVAVLAVVVYGVSQAAFATIDNGRTRTPRDAFAVLGVHNYKLASTLALYIAKYESPGRSFTLGGGRRFTQSLAVEILELRPDINSAVSEYMQYCNGALSSADVLGIGYYGSTVDRSKTHRFLAEASSGIATSAKSASALLAKRMIANRLSKSSFSTHSKAALAIIAWNYYMQDRDVAFLRYSEGMAFPRMDGVVVMDDLAGLLA